MQDILLVLRFLLALVFVVASVAKLANRRATQQMMLDFGAPAAFATPLAIFLPILELVVAVPLVVIPGGWWCVLGAVGLLTVFTLVIIAHLIRGHHPTCTCFGQLYVAPISWRLVVRNLVLLAVALLIGVYGPATSVPALSMLPGALSAFQLVVLLALGIVLVVMSIKGWLILQLMRQNGRLLLRLDALEQQIAALSDTTALTPAVVQAPDFELTDLQGKYQSLQSLRMRGRPILLLFIDPDCGMCVELLPDIAMWQVTYAERLTIAILTRGDSAENRTKLAGLNTQHVLIQRDNEIMRAYGISGTPAAVLVSADGTLASEIAAGIEMIRDLVAHAPITAWPATPVVPPLLENVLTLRLHDLDGTPTMFTLACGRPTLLLFWDPNCTFCEQVLDDVRVWEQHAHTNMLNIVLIATDVNERLRSTGLGVPILIDRELLAAQIFSVPGTPAALLIAADGQDVSKRAFGAAEVQELLAKQLPLNIAVP